MLLSLFLRHICDLMGIIYISICHDEAQSGDRNGRALSGMAIKLAPNASLSCPVAEDELILYGAVYNSITFSLSSARILYVAGMERL